VSTYEEVHAGDLVLGHDREVWGVETIAHVPRLAVTLVKDEGRVRVTGYPPAGTEVAIVQRADVSAEYAAAGTLIAAGLDVALVSERWSA
jgi:hypothetical protein